MSLFLNKVIAVESVPINDSSFVNTSPNDRSVDLNWSVISEYEIVSKRKILSFLLSKYTLVTVHSFVWFIERLQTLSNEQKVGLLRFDKEKSQKESFAAFIEQLYASSIKDPLVCQKLLCLYQELKPLGSKADPQRSDADFNKKTKLILGLSGANSASQNFIDFVKNLHIKKPAIGKDPKVALLECFEKKDYQKFDELLKIYKRILYPAVSQKLLDLFNEMLRTTELDPAEFDTNEIRETSTPVNTLIRSSTLISVNEIALKDGPSSASVPFDLRLETQELEKKIRIMFSATDKNQKRQDILFDLKKNVKVPVIVAHLLKNNFLLFLGHSKFKGQLKALCAGKDNSVVSRPLNFFGLY